MKTISPIRPKIVVSSCLGFAATRFNGDMLDNAFVRYLREKNVVEFLQVCPEVAIGLGVPRETLRVVIKDGEQHIIQPKTGNDVTEKMLAFVEEFTAELVADAFIFKANSPSVGPAHVKVYPSENAVVGQRGGPGYFTGKIIEKFPNHPLESDRRLKNTNIQVSFLTKAYTIARFREQVLEGDKKLDTFHHENYFLLKAHNPDNLAKLDSLAKGKNGEQSVLEYKNLLLTTIKHGTPRENLVLVFNELADKLAPDLDSSERKMINKKIALFSNNFLPKQAILSLFETFGLLTKNKEISSQTLLHPYPLELILLEDTLQERFLANGYNLEEH